MRYGTGSRQLTMAWQRFVGREFSSQRRMQGEPVDQQIDGRSLEMVQITLVIEVCGMTVPGIRQGAMTLISGFKP